MKIALTIVFIIFALIFFNGVCFVEANKDDRKNWTYCLIVTMISMVLINIF